MILPTRVSKIGFGSLPFCKRLRRRKTNMETRATTTPSNPAVMESECMRKQHCQRVSLQPGLILLRTAFMPVSHPCLRTLPLICIRVMGWKSSWVGVFVFGRALWCRPLKPKTQKTKPQIQDLSPSTPTNPKHPNS